MKKVYANLIGTWTDITHNGTIERKDPLKFIDEELTYKNGEFTAECFKYDYVNIEYGNANYRIHPTQIQIVTL